MRKSVFTLFLTFFAFCLSAEAQNTASDSLSPSTSQPDSVAPGGKMNLNQSDSAKQEVPAPPASNKINLKESDHQLAGQEDAKKKEKEAKPEKKTKVDDGEPHDPQKAVRRSAIIPGWGQVYNRSAWKVPIIYGGFGVFTYLFIDNNNKYRTAKQLYICSLDSACTEADPLRTSASYLSERDFYRRNRDLQVILGAVWYTLNIIDAMVEAHLKDFDVSDDLSIRVKPQLNFDPRNKRVVLGGGITLKLKR